MEYNRNIVHQTNTDYSYNLRLTKNSKGKKKKKNFKSYDDYSDIINQKKNNIKYNNINNYQPDNRKFAIIRNNGDIMKYYNKEDNKENDNNYYSLLNDFEVKYPKGNTNFYIIYNNSYKYPYKYINSNYTNIPLKSHHSFKLNVHHLMKKSNKKLYNYNIGKDSLPFCIYSKKSTNVDSNDIMKVNNSFNNQNYFDFPYKNNHFNYIRNYNKLENSEESKNNDAIMIEDYNNFKPNINYNNNNRKDSNNQSQENNESKEENSYNIEKSQKKKNNDKDIETSGEKKNESFSTDKFSFKDSDDELYNRGDLSTYAIVNILRLPKQRKKFNLKFLKQSKKENKNKKINIIENESKKDEDFKPIKKNIINNTNIKKNTSNSYSGKKKVKNVEFIRESLNYFYK